MQWIVRSAEPLRVPRVGRRPRRSHRFRRVGQTELPFGELVFLLFRPCEAWGPKAAKEVATAIRGGIIAAKLALIPVRRGYWGNRIGLPHTVPMKVHGKCGSVRVRLIPAPRGSSIVGSPISKKMLHFAGVADCFTCSCGHTKTKGNFATAAFEALRATYGYLTPDLWKPTTFLKSPYQEYTDYLAETKKAAVTYA